MILEDLLGGELELKQDDYSASRPIFGNQSQLTVLGWCGWRCQGIKNYIVKCSICSEDTELHGEGFYGISKAHIQAGRMPCGCSFNPKWTKEQYRVMCSRKASELGYVFINFYGEWKNRRTTLVLECVKHGQWSTTRICNLLNASRGCPKCGIDKISKSASKPDSEMIASFFASGAFHPDTKFWRSERKNKYGSKSYWYVSCPRCGEVGEGSYSNLQLGQKPCPCSKHKQKFCYINLIKEGDFYIGIKFGVTNNDKQRLEKLNRKSVYDIESFGLWAFPDKILCLAAERACVEKLSCGIVSKNEMKDGYTETTFLYNLDKIVEIYEEYGGVKVE